MGFESSAGQPFSAPKAARAIALQMLEEHDVAKAYSLWEPLATVLAAQPTTTLNPLEPVLRDYILLVTILVAFLEATALQLTPFQPPLVMGLSGLNRV